MDPIPEQEEFFRKNSVLTSFGQDIGDTLNQLQFEFEELENNHELPEEKIENVVPQAKQTMVEEAVKENFEKEIADEKDKSVKKSVYSMKVKAHMFDSLKNVRKRLHIKKGKHHNKDSKHKHEDAASTTSSEHSHTDESQPNSRMNSFSSDEKSDHEKTEQNNNYPPKIEIEDIKITSDSVGAYSTVPRKPKAAAKKVERSNTLSPQKKGVDIPGLSPVSRGETSSSTIPPVVIGGKLVHDYQYSRPIPPKSPLATDDKSKSRTKVTRNQSMSKLFRLVTSPQKSPMTPQKNGDTPLRELYKKTVMSQSVPYSMDAIGMSPTNSIDSCNTGEAQRHNSTSDMEEKTQYFSHNNEYYSTLPLPRKQKR